ncbi:hypothetical protein AQUCO_01400558v1, partial [Aquilegia coerulea]
DDSQTNFLQIGCSSEKVTNPVLFLANLNATFIDLRSQLSNGSRNFATAQLATEFNPAYAMVQCRNYLSRFNCLECFDVARARLGECSSSDGAKVIYDGCFLRYASHDFFNQATLPGNSGICGNTTVSWGLVKEFDTSVNHLLSDIVAATPRIDGFFAASKREVVSGGITVYAIAQCAMSLSQTGCKDCLSVAHNHLRRCPPYAEGKAIDAGCFLRYSDMPFFDGNQTTDLTLFLREDQSRKISPLDLPRDDGKERDTSEVPSFDFDTVAVATNGFSNKLGEGGFGPVYKGKLPDGLEVAVKRLSRSSDQGLVEFKNELKLISKLQHRNLVRILGFCIDNDEKILLYELMPHKSLDAYLFDPTRRAELDWDKRFSMIDGIARGLLYLHRDSRLNIIHRDLKASNILLDEDMNPKISDFGIARIFCGTQALANTTKRVVGTYGYMSPEYAMEGKFSEKSDVFSFGVLLLEIVSSKKNNDSSLLKQFPNLLGYAWELWNQDRVWEFMDPSLAESYHPQELMRCIHLGLLCVQEHPADRPTMSTVVTMLGCDSTLPTPKQPAFTLGREVQSGDAYSDASSTNDVTITIVEGR